MIGYKSLGRLEDSKVYKGILSVPSPSHSSLYEPFHQSYTKGKDIILIQK